MPSSTESPEGPPPRSDRDWVTTSAGCSGPAHGVPVWVDWYSSDGSQGRNSTPPTATATITRHVARTSLVPRRPAWPGPRGPPAAIAGGRHEPHRPVVGPEQRAGTAGPGRRGGPSSVAAARRCRPARRRGRAPSRASTCGSRCCSGWRRATRRARGPRPRPPCRPARRRPATHISGNSATTEHAGQRPDGHVAVAEQLHPAVEQEVVQRRVAVVAQGLGDVAERQPGDVDAERLVEPQRRAGHEPEGDGGEGQPDHDRHADQSPRSIEGPATVVGSGWPSR